MKTFEKLTALSLIAAMAGSMCACSSDANTPGTSGASEATVEESAAAGQSETLPEETGALKPEITESESSEGETEVTDATDATFATTTMPPEEVPTATEASETESSKSAEKPVIKVSDAFKKKFKHEGSKLVFKYPKVSISTVSTKAVNSKIKKDMKKLNNGYCWSDYSYYIGKDIVSICVWYENGDGDSYNCIAYNVSIATGKLVDGKAVLKEYGVTEKKFWSLVKSTYKKFGAGPGGGGSLDKQYYKKNAKKATFKYVTPYLNKKGQLCFIGFVYYDGGAGEGYRNFNTKTKKVLW